MSQRGGKRGEFTSRGGSLYRPSPVHLSQPYPVHPPPPVIFVTVNSGNYYSLPHPRPPPPRQQDKPGSSFHLHQPHQDHHVRRQQAHPSNHHRDAPPSYESVVRGCSGACSPERGVNAGRGRPTFSPRARGRPGPSRSRGRGVGRGQKQTGHQKSLEEQLSGLSLNLNVNLNTGRGRGRGRGRGQGGNVTEVKLVLNEMKNG